MRQFGLAAWLAFQDRGASAGMDRVGRKADALRRKFAGLKAGAMQFGRGIGSLALGFAPVTLGLGLVVREGIRFEQTMANLQAKIGGELDPRLKQLAQTLGATTVFTATQAGEGMTLLAQSGFEVGEVLKAVPTVLDAAAAENLDLATASGIVAANLKSFALEASDANRVADVLANTSRKTNTTMAALQEGMKLAAPAAKLAGASIEDTAAALGAFANVGLQGTLGGTAFRAALLKIVKPTKEGNRAFAKLGVSMKTLRGLLAKGKVIEAFQEISGRLGKIEDGGKRAALAMSIFQVRGAAAATAFKTKGQKGFEKWAEAMKEIRENSAGAAKEMAETQRKTLGGQLKLLTSAISGVSLEIFETLVTQTAGAVKTLAGSIGNLALALKVVRGVEIVDAKVKKQVEGIPPVIFEIARGLREGFAGVKSAFSGIFSGLKKVGSMFGVELGGTGVRSLTATITKFVVLGGAIAPIGIAILGVTKVAGGLFNVVSGGVKTVVSATRILTGAAGGILGKIPVLSKLVPGLAKAAGAAENITAMPVRVVNFHEAGTGLGGAGAAAGAAAAGKAGKAAAAGAGSKFLGAAARTAVGATLAIEAAEGNIGGVRGIAERAIAEAKKREALEREATALAKRRADILENSTLKFGRAFARIQASKPTVKALPVARDAIATSGGLLPVSAGDVVLDRAALASAVTSQARGGLAGRVGAGGLGGGDPGRTTPPTAGSGAQMTIQVPVVIDGRQVALAVAEARLDDIERSGGRLEPGDRGSLLTRGFLGGDR